MVSGWSYDVLGGGLHSGAGEGFGLKGNEVLDAYLALAVEQGATFVAGDRGFRRFGDLRVLRPGES